MPYYFLSFSTFALDSVPTHQDKPTSVIRRLSSNSNADISSSSNFDACNVHFKDHVFPTLTDDEYYKKNILFQNGVAFILEMHLRQDMTLNKPTTMVLVKVAQIIKSYMTTRIKNGNPYQIKITRKMAKTIN